MLDCVGSSSRAAWVHTSADASVHEKLEPTRTRKMMSATFKSVQFVFATALWCNVVPCVTSVGSSRQQHATLVRSDEQTGSEVVPVVSDTYFQIQQALNTNVSGSSFIRARATADKYSHAVAFSLGVFTSIVINVVLFIFCIGRGWLEPRECQESEVVSPCSAKFQWTCVGDGFFFFFLWDVERFALRVSRVLGHSKLSWFVESVS